jgi:hypothetical protein
MVCLNSKFPPPVELCWQNKNISKLGILITKVDNIVCSTKNSLAASHDKSEVPMS